MAAKNDKIEDLEQLEIWLKTQSIQVGQALAARAALRSLPAAMAGVNYDPDDTFAAKLLLFGLRATLVTVNACAQPANVAKDLINALKLATATGTIEFRAEEPVGAANYAILSVAEIDGKFSMQYAMSALLSTANIVGRTFGPAKPPEVDPLVSAVAPDIHPTGAVITHRESMRDVQDLKTGNPFSVFEAPLWQKPQTVERYTLRWDAFAKLPDPNGTWKFWREWYHGFLDGKPLNWELQRRVALIADDIWDAGPEAVADEIERIQACYLADQLPLAETIDLNPDTGKFRATPTPVENAPLMSALLTQISDDLEDAMAGHNGVTKSSSEARKIRRVITRYGNDPQQAELTLTSVAKGLRRQLYETGELPDSEDNLALLNSVEEGVRGIRANHPEVAANREQLAQLAIQELSAEDRETLEKAAPVLSAISEGALAEDFAEDIPELINDALLPLPSGAPRLPGADASTRIFSRVSKMALLSEKTKTGLKKGAEAFDSDLVKTIQLAGVTIGLGAGTVRFLYELVEIGLRVFGVL